MAGAAMAPTCRASSAWEQEARWGCEHGAGQPGGQATHTQLRNGGEPRAGIVRRTGAVRRGVLRRQGGPGSAERAAPHPPHAGRSSPRGLAPSAVAPVASGHGDSRGTRISGGVGSLHPRWLPGRRRWVRDRAVRPPHGTDKAGGGGCQACGRRLYIWLGQVHGDSVAARVARACRAPRFRAARGIRRPGRRLVATDGRGVRPRQAIHGQDLVARMRPLPSRPGGIAARRLPRGQKESIGRAARQLGGIYRPHRLCRMRAPPGAAGLGLKIDPLTAKNVFRWIAFLSPPRMAQTRPAPAFEANRGGSNSGQKSRCVQNQRIAGRLERRC